MLVIEGGMALFGAPFSVVLVVEGVLVGLLLHVSVTKCALSALACASKLFVVCICTTCTLVP